MELTDTVTIIGGIGGIQGIIEAIKWWRGRKVQDRHDVADVVATENENDRRQVDWLEKRLAERDAKIDRIYEELRAEQNARLEEIHRRHEAITNFKIKKYGKCRWIGTFYYPV